jgi:hypothetical protein
MARSTGYVGLCPRLPIAFAIRVAMAVFGLVPVLLL